MKWFFAILIFLSFTTSAQTVAEEARPFWYGSNTYAPADTNTQYTDADAGAFITATGITDSSYIKPLYRLVMDLKGFPNNTYFTVSTLWAKLTGIYPAPLNSGTSSSTLCKYNLKDPRDLDAAYRLTFAGSPTFSAATGIDFSSSGSYATTHYIPSAGALTFQDFHLSYYALATGTTGTQLHDMGIAVSAGGGSLKAGWYIGTGWNSSTASAELRMADSTISNGLVAINVNPAGGKLDPRGFVSANTISSGATYNIWVNGVRGASATYGTLSSASMARFTMELTIGAVNQSTGGAGTFTIWEGNGRRQCIWAAFGQGLTNNENLALYNAVQAYEKAIGRSIVY